MYPDTWPKKQIQDRIQRMLNIHQFCKQITRYDACSSYMVPTKNNFEAVTRIENWKAMPTNKQARKSIASMPYTDHSRHIHHDWYLTIIYGANKQQP